MPQALKLKGVEKQHQAVGLRFISAIDAVEYYVHQLVSIEERASKLGFGIVQGRSNWKARVSKTVPYSKQHSAPMSVISYIMNLIFLNISYFFTELFFCNTIFKLFR